MNRYIAVKVAAKQDQGVGQLIYRNLKSDQSAIKLQIYVPLSH